MPSAPDQPVDQLKALILAAQADDPLAPVTVVVPSNLCGLWLRYELGADSGLANVRFTSIATLADLIAAPILAESGRSALSALKAQRVVKELLGTSPDLFGHPPHHPVTIEAVASAVAQLRGLDAPRRRDFASGANGERRSKLIAVVERFENAIGQLYDEHDELAAAIDACRTDPSIVASLGAVVAYRIGDLSTSHRSFIEAVGAVPVEGPASGSFDQLDHLDHLKLASTPDPAGEVRAVLGFVANEIERATPLADIAIAHPGIEPWPRLLLDELELAGIATAGKAAATLAQTGPGRVLLGAYEIDTRGYTLDAVTSWLLCAPISIDNTGRTIPAVQWAWHARQAGVTRGVDNWAARLRERSADAHRRESERVDISAFVSFLTDLFGNAALAGIASARAWAAGSLSVLHRYVIKSNEPDAFVAVEGAIASIAALDTELLDAFEYRHMLATALEIPSGRSGVFGGGVFVGTIDEMAGASFRSVAVMGVVEGVFGRVPVGDGILLLPDRAAIDPSSNPRVALARAQDALRRVVNEAERALVTFPRSDPRLGRKQVPATIIVELARQLAGVRGGDVGIESITVRSLAEQRSTPWLDSIDSRAADLDRGDAPASAAEAQLRRSARLGVTDVEVQRGHRARQARLSDQFTEFDGLTAPFGSVDVTASMLSATRLETYAQCPRQYFLQYVLRLRDVEPIEVTEEITPRDRGSVLHATLDSLFEYAPRPETPIEPWPAEALELVSPTVAQKFAEHRDKGQTGDRLPARIKEASIASLVTRLLQFDNENRAAGGWVQTYSEFDFGRTGASPVVIDLPSGGSVTFTGYIDRIDLNSDGRRVRVIDYKTGQSKSASKVTEAMANGQRLQAYIYAEAARMLYPGAEVSFEYWFVSDAGIDPVCLESEKLGREKLQPVLQLIVDGIGSGVYPAHPGVNDANCTFCVAKTACDTDRERQWLRKREQPELSSYLALVGAHEADESNDAEASE